MKEIPKVTKSEFLDFVGRSKYLYNIRSEDNRLISYQPNQAQQILDDIRNEEFERSKKFTGYRQCKIILLKSRQIGGTTDTAMFNMDIMLYLNMASGIVLAHDDKSSPLIYKKYRLCYENLPDAIELTEDNGDRILDDEGNPTIIPVKPDTTSYSGYELTFKDNTESSIIVRTAGSGDNTGKGDTLNFCHMSEAANYDHFRDVYSSVNQALPDKSFVYSVIESTANGVSGKGEGFYKLWVKSVNEWERYQKGESQQFNGYRPVFIPWYKMKKYRAPLINNKLTDLEGIEWHNPEAKEEFLQMEEYLVENEFETEQEGLEAINWYRQCIKDKCNYDINEAKRYYPTIPEDAFLTTDSCFFNTTKLFKVKKEYENKEPECKVGYLDKDREFVESKNGELKIYEKPQPNYFYRYIVSLDPSYAVEGGDYACMFVYDRLEEKFVAKWYGNLKEDLLAEEFVKLGYYYNEAFLIPESNLKTVTTLIQPDGFVPYDGDIYKQVIRSRGKSEYGFNANGKTRSVLLHNYNRWLRDDYFKIPDLNSLDEHITFIKNVKKNGIAKYEATEGKHDDQVISMALCIEADNEYDEEIFISDQEQVQILDIIKPKKQRKRKLLRQSQLGT
jgi:hypothetical protein